ncbi:MAG: electron transfer flavoprotein subunit beta/FixA family protein [Polyangiaceae bacterium]|nr:electron transfer flavoprotein subunit beta/FixA family protein [Polyangiaceae bacterium]
MKILVALKRVADPANHNKVKIPASGDRIDTAGLEWQINPFDLYALETALRLTENGKNPKKREGEVVVLTIGPKETETNLRSALATGADRAIRIEAVDEELDGRLVAHALAKIVEEEKPDVVMMGKQVVDSETNMVGQVLAELLDWPMATFAATIQEQPDGLLVEREVDGGVAKVKVTLPAVVTVDLRIVSPTSVRSKHTEAGFKYPYEEVRFAPLPAIMQAKKKPLAIKNLSELTPDLKSTTRYVKYEAPPGRKAGIKVKDVQELVQKLATEAKVI